jgi:ectoine hydroxylase-related dioxygenase (phytanoyl-CoA dioxygenase family)
LEAASEQNEVMEKGDKEGNKTLLKMWNTAANDKYGLLARDERMVALAEGLIGKDIYLYSHKMTMKQPGEGGAWEWHQDFGYWHQYGCLAPEMLSIWIALDKSTVANGCLQVLPETHQLGRLHHIREDGQTNVDPDYLAAALDRYDLHYAEMEPGDALVFHCNLLHRSDANLSDTYRWGYICSYNAVENAPFKRVRDYGNFEELKAVAAGSFVDAA